MNNVNITMLETANNTNLNATKQLESVTEIKVLSKLCNDGIEEGFLTLEQSAIAFSAISKLSGLLELSLENNYQ